MAFNATFNNISVISWQSVLLVEETYCTPSLSGIRIHNRYWRKKYQNNGKNNTIVLSIRSCNLGVQINTCLSLIKIIHIKSYLFSVNINKIWRNIHNPYKNSIETRYLTFEVYIHIELTIYK